MPSPCDTSGAFRTSSILEPIPKVCNGWKADIALAVLPPVQNSQRENQSHCEDGKRRPNPFHSRSPNLGPMASIAE